MSVDELIQEIKEDKISGALELMIIAIKCFNSFSETFATESPVKYYEGILGI
jgi:translation initiation factor 2B subunit (eIF-2B alpha/beta/delta family)